MIATGLHVILDFTPISISHCIYLCIRVIMRRHTCIAFEIVKVLELGV